MKYIKVKWIHSNPEDPTTLYSELDTDQYEVRKVEEFLSGELGYASRSCHTKETELGLIDIPSIAEINQSSEFKAVKITKEEFERIWLLATTK